MKRKSMPQARNAALRTDVDAKLEAEVGCVPGDAALGLLVDRELARTGKLPREALNELSPEQRALILEGRSATEASVNVKAWQAELVERFGSVEVPPEIEHEDCRDPRCARERDHPPPHRSRVWDAGNTLEIIEEWDDPL